MKDISGKSALFKVISVENRVDIVDNFYSDRVVEKEKRKTFSGFFPDFGSLCKSMKMKKFFSFSKKGDKI